MGMSKAGDNTGITSQGEQVIGVCFMIQITLPTSRLEGYLCSQIRWASNTANLRGEKKGATPVALVAVVITGS